MNTISKITPNQFTYGPFPEIILGFKSYYPTPPIPYGRDNIVDTVANKILSTFNYEPSRLNKEAKRLEIIKRELDKTQAKGKQLDTII